LDSKEDAMTKIEKLAKDIDTLTLVEIRSEPLANLIQLRSALQNWHDLTDAEIQERVEKTRPKR
jgi:hypothetical protein